MRRVSILPVAGLLAAALVGGSSLPARADLAGCPIFPADNIWNVPVDTLPVHPRSADYIATIGRNTGLHPDFGSGTWQGGPIGIPFVVVPGGQPPVPIHFEQFTWSAGESDPGPYPVPPTAPIEGGPASQGDRHVLVLDRDRCKLYELYYAWPQEDGSWSAGSGAVYDLQSHALRPAGWTSADAAGLPMLPGLVRYDEVAAGAIRHAIRFTAQQTQRAYVWPARHYASSSSNPARPPMGQRFRLKASFDLTPFPPRVRVILQALKIYGLILGDNGSNWFLSGAPDPAWDDDELVSWLRQVRGEHFEAVDVSSLMIHPDSGQAVTDDGGGGGVGLSLQVNQSTFHAGETLRVGLSAHNDGPPVAVDFYLAIRLPDGASAAFLTRLTPPALAIGSLSGDPRAFPAAVQNIVLPQGFNVTLDDLVTYTFSGAEPPGEYTVMTALARAGALGDGVIGTDDLLAFETHSFTVSP